MNHAIVHQAEEVAIGTIAQTGGFWTGAERTALANAARAAQPRDLTSRPALADLSLDGASGIVDSPFTVEVATKVAVEAEQITSTWASAAIEGLGVGRYVELVSVVATVIALDRFRAGLSLDPLPLATPVAGEPAQVLAEGLGDAGAHVPMLLDYRGPNVGRAMSAVPEALMLFFPLVSTFYSENDFESLEWQGRALSRPQIELVASRTSALNQCFY